MNFISQFAQTYTTYTTTTSTTNDPSPGVSLAIFFVIFMIIVITYALDSFLLGRVFKKAGVKQWIAWVPFYNSWKKLELGDQQGFWAVMTIIPIVNIVATVFLYIAMYNIGLKLGKEGWFVLLAIFIPIVWTAWLAFDSSQWNNGGTLPPTPGLPPVPSYTT